MIQDLNICFQELTIFEIYMVIRFKVPKELSVKSGISHQLLTYKCFFFPCHYKHPGKYGQSQTADIFLSGWVLLSIFLAIKIDKETDISM